MNAKNIAWAITYEDNLEGGIQGCYAKDLREVAAILVSLQQSGVNPDDVSVFPPESNLTYAELLDKALVEKVIEDSLNRDTN